MRKTAKRTKKLWLNIMTVNFFNQLGRQLHNETLNLVK